MVDCLLKEKPEPSRTIRTPENGERVKQTVLRSPKQSASKYAAALTVSDDFFHEDLKFHQYK